MERILRELFDMQRFEGDPVLQSVIDAVEARYADQMDQAERADWNADQAYQRQYANYRELSMDDLDFVAAAGEPHVQNPDPDREKELW